MAEMKVYRISGNCIGGGYYDGVTVYDAKETKKLIIVGKNTSSKTRHLNKDKDIDVYKTADHEKLITVFTLDPAKVADHLSEIRFRLQNKLDFDRQQAMMSLSHKAHHESSHLATYWDTFVSEWKGESS